MPVMIPVGIKNFLEGKFSQNSSAKMYSPFSICNGVGKERVYRSSIISSLEYTNSIEDTRLLVHSLL